MSKQFSLLKAKLCNLEITDKELNKEKAPTVAPKLPSN